MNTKPNRLFNIYGEHCGTGFAGNVWDIQSVCPTLMTMGGGNRQPMILVKGVNKEVKVDSQNINVIGNYMPSNHDASRIVHPGGVAPTVKENHGTVTATIQKKDIPLALDEQNGYIRTDGTVGTIVTDGSSPKHNNRVLEPKLLGGFGEKNFGKQFRQGNRVYDSEGVSMAIMSNPVGNMGGNSYLYAVKQSPNNMSEHYVSEKGVKYICEPKRGMCTDINAEVIQPLTARGQANWTGSFVSPDIDHLEKSSTIGSTEPTKIHLKNGSTITSNDDLSNYRIRKLTPKECWRLMGFDDVDFDKAEKVCSNTQLYKQAGNSIVVNVLEGILGNLLPKKSRSEWLDDLLGV